MKKALSVWLALCLSFQGLSCAVISVTDEFTKKGKEPVNIRNFPVKTKTGATEEKTIFSPSRIEIVSPLPPLPSGQNDYRKLRLTPRFSVENLQKISRKEKLEIIVLPDTVVLETASFDGKKWFTGWVEPGTILLGREKEESQNNAKIYEIVKLGVCGNAVRGLTIEVIPLSTNRETFTTVEKTFRSQETFVDSTTIIQTQKSYWPWLITTAALIGLGIALWPKKEKKNDGPCDPSGSPAPR